MNLTRRAAFAILGASAVLIIVALVGDLNATYKADVRAALAILALIAYVTIIVLVRKGLGHFR